MRVFQFNIQAEKHFIAAHTFIEAIQLLCNLQSLSITDLHYEDDIIEVPREDWAEMKIKDPENEGEEISFLEYVNNLDIPEMIASTEEQ